MVSRLDSTQSDQQLWQCPPAIHFRTESTCDPLPHSLVDLSSRRPKHGSTSSPAQSVVGGTSPGNQYQVAREDCIDPLIMWMDDDHPVDIMEELKRPRVLRDFPMNPNAPQWYDQLVAWITRQYNLAIYWRAVDSCLVSTTSTQGGSPWSSVSLIDSPLAESIWDDCLTFAEIEGHLMVTFVTINKTAMVDDTDNEIEFIKTNPLNHRGQRHGMTLSGSWGPAGLTGVTDPLCNLHLRTDQMGWRVCIRSRRAVLCRWPWLGGNQIRCQPGRLNSWEVCSTQHRVGK